MALTPLEIHNKEFRKTFRGYSEEEVDEFLDEIVRDMEILIRENNQLRDDLSQVRGRLDQYQAIESTLQSTLVVAQQSAEDLKENARKEAALIVQEAHDEAERIIAAARQQEEKLLADLQEAQREYAVFRSKVRSILLAQLELMAEPGEGTATADEADAAELSSASNASESVAYTVDQTAASAAAPGVGSAPDPGVAAASNPLHTSTFSRGFGGREDRLGL